MRNILAGVAVAVAAVVWGTGAAEAQVTVQPIGPGCIESDDTSTLYQATVTCDYDFEFSLKVYRNSTLVDSSLEYVVNDGPSYNYSKSFDCSGWGMVTGDRILFRAKATIMEGPHLGTYATANHSVTVSAPGSCFLEPRRRQDGSWA